MEWLTQELTPIEKVRRNVILLAALAFLASFFVIETDQMTFLGARFSSDVIVFGLFHALAFYTGVLIVRARFHERLVREAAGADQVQRDAALHRARREIVVAREIIEGKSPNYLEGLVNTEAVEEGARRLAGLAEAQAAEERAKREIKYWEGAGAFRQQGRWLIVIGEFVFPVALGLYALVQLWNSQDITMLWELHLRSD